MGRELEDQEQVVGAGGSKGGDNGVEGELEG